jgi:hypothetical protein
VEHVLWMRYDALAHLFTVFGAHVDSVAPGASRRSCARARVTGTESQCCSGPRRLLACYREGLVGIAPRLLLRP